MIVFAYIRSFFQWILFIFALLFLVAWPLFRQLFSKDYNVHQFFMKMSPVFVKISGIKLVVDGQEHIDPDKSYIVTFNHFNFFDHFFLYGVLGLKLAGLEKEQHMKIPVYGRFMKIAGIIPIPQRGNTEKALQGLNRAKEKMKEGFSILIAPEGTRCRDAKLGNFKKGGFYMAVQTQNPILPVVYDKGMYQFHGRGRFLLKPTTVHLKILPPIETHNLNESNINELRDNLRKQYVDLNGESYI